MQGYITVRSCIAGNKMCLPCAHIGTTMQEPVNDIRLRAIDAAASLFTLPVS